ncbi:MAG: esterase-like activity of phytase family protein [Cyanobacteriota bacterium]|nr:esterase-like activity of phytase family protein [Cyanobacteriota bacterium]
MVTLTTLLRTGLIGGISALLLFTDPVSPHPTASLPISGLTLWGEAILPHGSVTVAGTPMGGLSGLTYDAKRHLYYAVSDDPSQNGPARFYTLTIQGGAKPRDPMRVEVVGVTPLRRPDGQPFGKGTVDPEGIAYTTQDSLWIASEGIVNRQGNRLITPFIHEFDRQGRHRGALPIPPKVMPRLVNGIPVAGIRHNLSLESLTLTPDQRFLLTATENALVPDGEVASPTSGSLARILKYDLRQGTVVREALYVTDPVAAPPLIANGFQTSGLVELLALDNSGEQLLALERSFAVGRGHRITIYRVDLAGATPIQEIDSLKAIDISSIVPAQKQLLLSLETLRLPNGLSNLEGMTLGSLLPNGQPSLVLISDDNFQAGQFTQVLLFSLDF